MSRRPAADAALPTRLTWPAWAWMLVAVGGLTVLRVALLFVTDLQLYGDEAQYWTYGEELAFGHYSKPPMVGWLAKLTTEIGGLTEAWVRLSSPLCHAAAALLLYALARRLYDESTALLAGVLYVSLPAVSYASLLLSTDTPLLLFWVLGLLSLWRLYEGGSLAWAAGLGIALGGGLLSKYAMGYLIVGIVVFAAISPAGRQLLRRPGLWLGLVLGLAFFSPNLLWNLQHGGATMTHIAENANVGQEVLRPWEALDFFVSQFGVFGPVVFAVLLLRVALWRRHTPDTRERFLIAFSLPIFLLIQAQGLMAGANANWAATGVPAAALLAVGWLRTLGRPLWIRLQLAINALVVVALTAFAAQPTIATAVVDDPPLDKLSGWRALAAEVEGRAAACGCDLVLLDHRFEFAQLWFYGDFGPDRLRMWMTADVSNHYELMWPFSPPASQRTLYVTERPNVDRILERLGPVAERDSFSVPVSGGEARTYRTFVLDPAAGASAG